MALEGAARSPEALALTAGLLKAAYSGARLPGRKYRAAMEALVCDLIQNGRKDSSEWGFRSMQTKELTGERIKAWTFKSAYNDLTAIGMIERAPDRHMYMIDSDRAPGSFQAARHRGTPAFFELVRASGIAPNAWADHFELIYQPPTADIDGPLERRRASNIVGQTKHRGNALPIDLNDPQTRALHDRVVRLNTFMVQHPIAGLGHRGFRRIFNDGLNPQFDWNKGGRLYSVEGTSYQVAKPADRALMTVGGEKVVEIDITACHLTILHALNGIDFDPSIDPYNVASLPRKVVKAWVTMTMGYSKHHKRWPDKVTKDLEEKLGCNLKETYPLAMVRDIIVDHIPLLKDWAKSPYRWTDLQYLESLAIVGTVETLAFEHGVPCFPVHDSIIIPATKEGLGREVLSATFKQAVGVFPHLK